MSWLASLQVVCTRAWFAVHGNAGVNNIWNASEQQLSGIMQQYDDEICYYGTLQGLQMRMRKQRWILCTSCVCYGVVYAAHVGCVRYSVHALYLLVYLSRTCRCSGWSTSAIHASIRQAEQLLVGCEVIACLSAKSRYAVDNIFPPLRSHADIQYQILQRRLKFPNKLKRIPLLSIPKAFPSKPISNMLYTVWRV